MKKNVKKFLLAVIIAVGILSPFSHVYADNNVKLDLNLTNSEGGAGIVLFHDASKEFTYSIDKTNLPGDYQIVLRTWFDEVYDYAVFKDTGYYAWFPANKEFFVPDETYALSYKFKLKKNGKYIDWDHDFNKADVTINGISATDSSALSKVGIQDVGVEFVYSGNSDFEDLVVSIYFNKTAKAGYGEPPCKFDSSYDGTYIESKKSDEMIVYGNGALSLEMLQRVTFWFEYLIDGYQKMYFEAPSSGGYGIKLPIDSAYLLANYESGKEFHLSEKCFDTRNVVNMNHLCSATVITGRVNFDVTKVTDMTSAFEGTKIEQITLRNGNNIKANNMLNNVNTLERLEFTGLTGLSIKPNTFVDDYQVIDRTANTTESKSKNDGYNFIDNHDYLVVLASQAEQIDNQVKTQDLPKANRQSEVSVKPTESNAQVQTQTMPKIGTHSENYAESIINKVNYQDSKSSDWFYPYVNYVTNRQIMNGTGNQIFSPNSRITKAMLATMLFRLSGDDKVDSNHVAVDLEGATWYTEPAKWTLKNGIANTNARNEFQPNHELTREEFIKMIYLYANYKGYYTGDEADLANYVDTNMLSDDCVNPFKWAVQIGMINGLDDTHLAPKNTSNRAQMATIFTRFMDIYGL